LVGFELEDRQRDWLTNQLRKERIISWQLAETIADASFRCYHRIVHPQGSYILMHFLPEKEDGKRIVQTAEFFLAHKVRIPQLYGHNISLGLLLQEDMGSNLLVARSTSAMDSSIYHKAVDELIKLQRLDASEFGSFTEEWQLQEMELFSKWFLKDWLGYGIPADRLNDYYHSLTQALAAAPNCCIHMDFHSRNLVLLPNDAIGVLDYQDVCMGHFCYDMVSLLCDAYIRLPDELAKQLMSYWMMETKSFFQINDEAFFHHQFALMTLQRCVKVCGTFARLFLRDKKARYLGDMPLVLSYLNRAVAQLLDTEEGTGKSRDGHRFFQQLLADIEPIVKEKIASVAEEGR